MPTPIKNDMSNVEVTVLSDEEWVKQCRKDRFYVEDNATFPYTDRDLKIWYRSWLADTGMFKRTALVLASLDQLKDWHRELTK